MPSAAKVRYSPGIEQLGSITCKLIAKGFASGAPVGDTITLTELLDALSNPTGVYEGTSSVGLSGTYWAVLTGGMVDGGFVEMTNDTTVHDILSGSMATLALSQSTAVLIAMANALLDLTDGVETGETVREFFRNARGALLGESTGFPAGPGKYKSKDGTKDRVIVTMDGKGNRSTVTTDPS